MNYSFSVFNKFAEYGITTSLDEIIINKSKNIVIVCIGTDLALGDSLGPIVGSLLKDKYNIDNYVYGNLKKPITAKEIKYLNGYLKIIHPDCTIIAIDAAIGNKDDIGLIKINDYGLKPGLGVNKELDIIGDISILGIVNVKTFYNYSLLNCTRLNLINSMSETIAKALYNYFKAFELDTTIKNLRQL